MKNCKKNKCIFLYHEKNFPYKNCWILYVIYLFKSSCNSISKVIVNNEIESEHKGGTDRGPYGGGWMIDAEENHLHIYAGQ